MKKFIILFVCLILVACSQKKVEEKKLSQSEREDKLKELLTLEENEILVAKIATYMGDIEIELFAKQTPKTVENFAGLALKGYYDGVAFHRVIAEFMIQGGDPSGTGSGGQSLWGGDFEDEIVPSLQHDGPGILSMANRGPNTNSSQFFITLVPTPWLDGKHTVFGKVIAGADVVEKIGNVATTPPFDKPVKEVKMEKVTVEKRTK